MGHNALPSFRTPGFGKPKARKSEPETSTAREVIDLSCSSPSPRSKRQLETQHITDAFPSKRRRSGLFDDKENLSFINGDINGKGKAKEMDDVEGLVDVCSKESTERASLTKRDLYDPFDQLDIDFPSFKRNPRLNQHPQHPTQDHKDLESVYCFATFHHADSSSLRFRKALLTFAGFLNSSFLCNIPTTVRLNSIESHGTQEWILSLWRVSSTCYKRDEHLLVGLIRILGHCLAAESMPYVKFWNLRRALIVTHAWLHRLISMASTTQALCP